MIALLPHCGFLSETTRMLAIARALRAKGARVILATHGGPYTRVLDEAGEAYTMLSPIMDRTRCARYVDGVVDIGRPGSRLQSPNEVRASVDAEVEFFRAHVVTMAVIGFTLTAYLSTRVVGIPLATSHGGSFVPPVFEAGLAPVPTTMPIPLTEWLPQNIKRWLVNSGPMRLTDPTRFLNDVARDLNVEPVPSLAALMLGDLTLVTDTPEMLGISHDVMRQWRPATSSRPSAWRPDTRLVYTGPLFAQLDHPVSDRVREFLHAGRPVAYVVLSSATPERLRAVVSRVRAAGMHVLVGATIHDYGPVNDPNVMVEGILPSHEIMPLVDVAVTMGGQGTVQTAMACGTPIVAMPLHAEQELNVALAARVGMGVAIAPRHADTERMTHAVREVVQSSRYRAGAQRAKAMYRDQDGAAQAAEVLLRGV